MWQLTQANGPESAGAVDPWLTWARWAPTASALEAAMGGATGCSASAPATLARPAVPWHEVQESAFTSTTPLMWLTMLTAVLVLAVVGASA